MTRVVVLDTGPLGLVTNPHASPVNDPCIRWLRALLAKGDLVVVPEIADYEVRRELLRARRTKGINKLDALKSVPYYAAITTGVMLQAAEFWAQARNTGHPTADAKALDGTLSWRPKRPRWRALETKL